MVEYDSVKTVAIIALLAAVAASGTEAFPRKGKRASERGTLVMISRLSILVFASFLVDLLALAPAFAQDDKLKKEELDQASRTGCTLS
jgi:hypothetical protein